MSENTVQFDFRGMDKLIRALKSSAVLQVGIIGDAGRARKGKNQPSNAFIGAMHETGNESMPQRSWLRMPLIEHLQGYLEKSGAFDRDAMRKVLNTGTIVPWLKKVGLVAENVIADAFATGGFGKWAPWKRKSYTNNTGQILVDTQQLRNAVTSRVVEK